MSDDLSDGEYDQDTGSSRLFTPDQLEEAVDDVTTSLQDAVTDNEKAKCLLNLEFVIQHGIKYSEAKNTATGLRAVARGCWKNVLVHAILTTALSLSRGTKVNVGTIERLLAVLETVCTTPIRGIERKLSDEKVGTALLVLAERSSPLLQPISVDTLVTIAATRRGFCTELAEESIIVGLLSRCHKIARPSVLALLSTVAEYGDESAVEELGVKRGSELLLQLVALTHESEPDDVNAGAFEALTAICVGRKLATDALRRISKDGKLLRTARILAHDYHEATSQREKEDPKWQSTAAAHDFMEHLGDILRHVPPTEKEAARRIQTLFRSFMAKCVLHKLKQGNIEAKKLLRTRLEEGREQAIRELVEQSATIRAIALARGRRVKTTMDDLKTLRTLPAAEAAKHWEIRRNEAATSIQKWWRHQQKPHKIMQEMWSDKQDRAARLIHRCIMRYRRRKQIADARRATYLGTALNASYDTADAMERRRRDIQQRILDNVARDIYRDDKEGEYAGVYDKLASRGRLRPLALAASQRRAKLVRESADYCRRLDTPVDLATIGPTGKIGDRRAKEWYKTGLEEAEILNPSIVFQM